MTLIDAITENINSLGGCKKITPKEVASLGYILSKNKILLSRDNKPPSLRLYKLIDETNPRKKVDFCYLYTIKADTGIILTRPFDYFLQLD